MQTIRILALVLALVSVSRAALPTIDTQPASSTNCPGTTATFTVTASSDSSTNYQWYFNVTNAVADATNASYAVVGVAASNAGGYSVVVANNDGSVTSVVAQLVVNVATTASGPANTSVCVNGTTVLTTTPGGTGPFTYVWRKDGGAPLGSVGNTHTISGATLGDAGVYSVEVSGSCNSVTNSATLTVNPLPSVAVNSVTVCSNNPGVLTATTGAANPAYLWTPGGQTTASVTNTPISTTVYTVLVTDGVTGCTNSGSGTITVQPRTTSTALANQTNCPASSITFSTTAGGTGPFTYTWRKNGTVVQGPNGTSSYNIPSAVAADSGTYSVETAGSCNTVTNSAFLQIIAAPVITTQPANFTTPMGNGATFTVVATTVNSTVGPLSYQWRTNGVNVTGATSSSFSISNVSLSLNGLQVSCRVSSCGGVTLSSAATLTITPITGISFDFNTPGQYTNAPYNLFGNDWVNTAIVNAQPFGPILPFEQPTGGVGVATGGGVLDLIHNNGSDQTSLLVPVTYDFSLPGKSLTASIMIKVKLGISLNRATQLGFVAITNLPSLNNTMQGIAANNGQGFMSVILQSTVTNQSPPLLGYSLRAQVKATNGTVATEYLPVNTPTNSLSSNNWYRLVAKFVNTRTTNSSAATNLNTFTIEATLQDMGSNGMIPGPIVLAYTPITCISNLDFVYHNSLFFAVRGIETGGVDYWDNLFVSTTPGNVFFVQQPTNTTVLQGRWTTLYAMVDGDGPYTYQWSKNGTPIPGAGNWKYQTPQVTTADNGAVYTVTVTSTNNSITSAGATLTVTPDTLDVLSVGSVDGGLIGLRFDQPVAPGSAEIAGNYLINGTPALSAKLRVFNPLNPMQQLRTNQTEVLLVPASPVAGSFTVTVSGVTSISGTALGANNSAVGSVLGLTSFDVDPQAIRFSRPEISGAQVSTLPGYTYSFAPNQLELVSGGHDVFGNFDGFHFAYKQITGDFDLKVRVPYVDLVRTPTKAGFDARISLDADAPNVGVFADPALPGRNFAEAGARTNYNQATVSWGNNATLTYPNAWIRFRRAGNTFLRYSSTNGIFWQFDGQFSPSSPGSQGMQFPDTLFVGVAGNCNVGGGTIQQYAVSQYDQYGDFAGYANALLTIAAQPNLGQTNVAGNSTNLNGLMVTFTTNGVTVPATLGEMAFIWQRANGLGGWTNLPTAGLTASNLVTGALFGNDNGAQYRAIVRAPGALSVTSAVVTMTVIDLTPPTVVSVLMPSNSPNQVIVYFSEKVSDATALNTANYRLTNLLTGVTYTIARAQSYLGDNRTVILTINGPLPPSPRYSLGVSGVQDLGGQTVATTAPSFAMTGMGLVNSVEVDYYGSLANSSSLADLTGNIKFINNQPDWIMYSNSMNMGGGAFAFPASTPLLGDNYGVKMFTYFIAPSNSQYVFWWKADDYAQFSMTTNPAATGGTTNPLFKTSAPILTANVPIFTNANTFITPPLTAGQAYYTELLYKEGGGGDGGVIFVTMGGTTNAIPLGNSIAPTYLWSFPDAVARPPKMLMEFYTGLNNVGQVGQSGNGNLPDLQWVTNFQNVVAGTPNGIGYVNISGYSTNLGNTSLDAYLGRLRGYFLPPTNGNYRFYTRSDDSCEFYMNTNAVNSTDPAGRSFLRAQFAFTNITQLWQTPVVTLTGGQLYYIEGIFREGAGGDGMTIAVSGGDEPAPTGGLDLIPQSMLVFPTNLDRVGPVNFNQAGSAGGLAPMNPTVTDGQKITFQARGLAGSAPYLGFIFAKNGVQMQSCPTVTYPANAPYFWVSPPFTAADNGAVITLTVTNYFSSVTVTSIVTVLADNTAPTIVSAVSSQYGGQVLITFSENVDSTTATRAGNYSIPGLTVYAAWRDDVNPNRVSLQTSPQTPGTTYTVTINGVKDLSTGGNAMSGASKSFTTWGFGGLGTAYVEIFTNIASTSPDFFFNDPKGVYNMPDISYYTNTFSISQFGAHGGLEFYAGRVSGLFMPPSNGLYQFYVRGDDGTRLYMNTNGPAPADKVLVARNDGANSGPVGASSGYITGTANGRVGNSATPVLSLTNGTPYYLEGIMKEGGGGDYLMVVMRALDPLTLLPIGGLPLTPAATDVVSGGFFQATGNPDINQLVVISAPPTELTVFENDLVNLELVANAIPPSLTPYITYQWQRTNDGSGTFTNIPNATTASYSFYASLSDDSTHYRLRATIPGQTVFFSTLLHVLVDTVPPYIVSVSARTPINGKQLVGLAWDGPTDPGIATDPSGYYAVDEFSTTVNFVTVQYRPGFPNQLLLQVDETSGILIGNFTIYRDFMQDRAAVPNPAFNLTATGAVQRLSEQIVGTIGSIAAGGYNANAPGLGFVGLATPTEMFTVTNAGWDVSANGWDIWNNADGFLFGHREVTGNFDIKTRLQKFTGADQWSKAGLMVRPSTNSNSRMFFMGTTPRTTPIAGQVPNNFFAAQYRDLDGGAPGNVQNAVPPGYPNAWVRLQRSNSVFYGYWSTNGTDWNVLFSRDFSGTIAGGFPDTVLVGLGTCSHDQTRSLANNAYVEYRNLYFPNGAVILTQPEPAFVEVGIHQSVTFSNLTASGAGVRYQWRLNGAAITDATNASLTLPNTAVGQSGIYTVAAYTDGGGQISSNVVLSVTNVLPTVVNDSLTATQGMVRTFPASFLLANDSDFELDPLSVLSVFYPHTLATNFDGGAFSGSVMYGNATNVSTGGTGDSGRIRLNDALASQAGSVVFNEVTPGARVLAFRAAFNLRIAEGSAEPADGFSFNFAGDLPNAATGARASEDGLGSGFSFCVDNYRFLPFVGVGAAAGSGASTTANTSGMKVNYGNIVRAGVQAPTWNNTAYIPVDITLESNGRLTVLVNGTNVFGTFTIPWVPQAGRFGFFARTGGQLESHSIDDLNISYIAEDTQRGGLLTYTNGVVAYSPPSIGCGLDRFFYIASDGQVGGTNVGTVTVNIVSSNAPVIVSCAANQTYYVSGGCTVNLPNLTGGLVVTDCGTYTITQSPAAGTALGLGNTIVTFDVTNSGGLSTNCQITVSVLDTNAPSVTCPANIVTEATGPSGRVVTYAPSGSDNCTLASLVANPASGSTFPLGVTVVTVTATDNSGNTNACTFTVTVQDTTAPVITCPTNITTACTSTNGAVVNYTVTSVDQVDPNPTLIVTPPSGSTFAPGTNLVTALTYDAAGNTNTCSFLVIVQDQTPAILSINKVGTNVVVCYPQTCTPYVLEGATDLTPPISWTPVGLPASAVGADFCVTIPADLPYNFFRLRKP